MRILLINVLLLFLFLSAAAQQAPVTGPRTAETNSPFAENHSPGTKLSVISAKILSKKEADAVLSPALKTQLKINFPVRRIYRCEDGSGQFLLVVTETNDHIDKDNDTLHHRISVLNLAYTDAGLIKKWEINDMALISDKADHPEKSIWFFTKFFRLEDMDNDGLIDPIVVYGSSGKDDDEYGRIKIIICYKGQKIAIRHQDGSLDNERNTQVDKAFYSLPLKIKSKVRETMKMIVAANLAIFPYGWEKTMDKTKTYIDENH